MDEEQIKYEMNRVEKIEVKERVQNEHLFLIRYRHDGSVRNYLLSMGAFKEVKIEEMSEAEFLLWLYSVIGDDQEDYMLEISKRINKLKEKKE